MRNITKGAEPKSLETHRCSAYAHYDNLADKQNLRESLVAEQQGLCCYCMSRISANSGKMKIEHWQSQDNYPERQLEYSNLLGSCLGGEGKPLKLQHCDTRKRSLVLSMNPSDPLHDVERVIRYDSDGTIRSTEPAFENELNKILNLNHAILKNNRKAVLRGLLESLPKDGNWNNSLLEKQLAQWNSNSDALLAPYCQVVIYWLRKRLKRTH